MRTLLGTIMLVMLTAGAVCAQTPVPLATGTALSASSLGLMNPTAAPTPTPAPTPVIAYIYAQECSAAGKCDAPSILPRVGSLSAIPPSLPYGSIGTGTGVLPAVTLGDTVVLTVPEAPTLPVIVTVNGVAYAASGPIKVVANAPGVSTASVTMPGVLSNRMTILVR